MRKTREMMILLVAAGALTAAACGSTAKTTKATAPVKQAVAHEAAPACPVEDPANHVEVKDVEGGVAVDVTTTGDVAALRAKMAARRAYMKAHGKPGPIPTEKKIVEIDGGFRKLILAKDPADVDKLRKHVRSHIMGERGEAGDHHEAAGAPACPIEDKANKVELKDIPGGVAIEVTTTGDAAALRAQMAARAAFLAAHKKGTPKIQTEKKIEEIEGGFRRTIVVKDWQNHPEDVKKLRQGLRHHIGEERGE